MDILITRYVVKGVLFFSLHGHFQHKRECTHYLYSSSSSSSSSSCAQKVSDNRLVLLQKQ